MAKIVKCTEGIIAKIPSVMKYLDKEFGNNKIVVYAVLADDNIGFIALSHYKGLYIRNEYDGYSLTPFQLKESLEVGMVKIGEDSFYFDDDSMFMVDRQGIEHTVRLSALDYLDEDEYNGVICYSQYNSENDTFCSIWYQQMYNEINGKAPIYSYHTKKIDILLIDEQYSKRGNNHSGFLSKHSKYFTRYEVDSEQIGYTLTAIRDFGLLDVITKGAYNLQKENRVIRYIKAFYEKKDGTFVDAWPFARQAKPEELKELIRGYGFSSEAPFILLSVYNGQEKIVSELQELAFQMKELGNCVDEEMCMILQLMPEKEDK